MTITASIHKPNRFEPQLILSNAIQIIKGRQSKGSVQNRRINIISPILSSAGEKKHPQCTFTGGISYAAFALQKCTDANTQPLWLFIVAENATCSLGVFRFGIGTEMMPLVECATKKS